MVRFDSLRSIFSSADRYNSDKEQQENVDEYIATHNRCIDIFEEYVEVLRRQHGIVRDPASDPPVFEPGITVSWMIFAGPSARSVSCPLRSWDRN